MKKRILSISVGANPGSETEAPPIKEEVFYNNTRNNFRKGGNRNNTLNRNITDTPKNPKGKDGVVLKCFECGSYNHLLPDCPRRKNTRSENVRKDNGPKCFSCGSSKHFIADCPESRNESKQKGRTYEINLTLIGSGKSSDSEKSHTGLLPEALGMAVLDSGCTKTVAGRTWMDEFMHTLTDEPKALVMKNQTRSIFRFGDGRESLSEESLDIPVTIGSQNYMISTDVVSNDIPLLLSKKAMKKAGMVLDFSNDTAEFGGENISLICLSTGHYAIPLTKFILRKDVDLVRHITLYSTGQKMQNMSKEEKNKKALKLHRQFCHATKEKLIKLGGGIYMRYFTV